MNLLEMPAITTKQKLIKLKSIKLACIDFILWAGHYDRC